MKRTIITAAIAAAMLLGSAGTAAAYTIDGDGNGFVGKGEVQLAFGWNNTQVQTAAPGVSFTLSEVAEYTMVCSRVHDRNGYQEQTFKNREIGLTSAIEVDTRRNGKGAVTGFLLQGWDGEPEYTGEGCPSGWPNEESRELNEDAGEGGLYATSGGVTHLIP
jgi:hypothetical protein